MKTVLIFSALVLSSVGFAQSPKLGEVKIKDVTVMGSGCPAGTASVSVMGSTSESKSADYLAVIYDDFIAKAGEGTSSRDQRKNCNIGFNVEFPKGYRFYFQSIQYYGFAKLENGTNAEFQTVVRTPFGSRIKYKSLLRGPFDGEFSDEETAGVLKKFDSGCEGSALVKLENKIRIKGDTKKPAIVAIDLADANGHQGVSIGWEKCD